MKSQGASILVAAACLLTSSWGSAQRAPEGAEHQPASTPAPPLAQGSAATPEVAPQAATRDPSQPSSRRGTAGPGPDSAPATRGQPLTAGARILPARQAPAPSQRDVATQPEPTHHPAARPTAPPVPAHEISVLVPLFRLGLTVTGWASDALTCSGNDCPSSASGSGAAGQARQRPLGRRRYRLSPRRYRQSDAISAFSQDPFRSQPEAALAPI